MNNIKLTLTNWGDLDLGGESAIPLNYNLNDVRDISTRGGEYSKTIKLYGTAKNNTILGPIFNVDTQFLTFNPQVVEPCILSRDGEVVLEGTFQIRRILKRYTNENEIIIYDVYLKSNNSDFYTIIDSRFLTDLDMSAYNHFHSKDVIIDSMRNGNFTNGYQYFLADTPIIEWPINSYNLMHLYEPDDFKPAIYVKSILDRIVSEAGFTYDFEELFEHNIDKLIITTNRESIVPAIAGKLFRAGITFETGGQQPYDTSYWQYPNLNYVSQATGIPDGTIQQPWSIVQGQVSIDITDYYWAPVDPVLFQPPVIFDNDNNVQLNLYDGANAYNNIVGEYTLDPDEQSMYFETTFIINTWIKPELDMSPYGYVSSQVIDMDTQFNQIGEIRLDTELGYEFEDGFEWNHDGNDANLNAVNNNGTNVKERLTGLILAFDANDQPIFPPIGQTEIGINEYTYGGAGMRWRYLNGFNYTNEFVVNISGEFSRFLHPNAVKVKVLVVSDFQSLNGNFWGFRWSGEGYLNNVFPLTFIDIGEQPKVNARFGFIVVDTNPIGYFKNDISKSFGEGVFVNMNNVIPTDMKQSDFLLSLVKMYNLYITNDKDNYRNLIIKTRDKFYEDGLELDWSNKVDINSIELDILSNTQTKIKNFLYSEDGDDAILKAYKDFTKYDYGQLEYIFFNQFIKDSSEIKPDFSTAVLEWKYKKNIPLIPSRAKTNVKILSVGQVYTDDKYFTYRISNNTFGIPVLTEDQYVYRHVGHFYPNSFEPKEDINFGVCEFYTHNYSTITNNNLFNRFYRTQFDIFENGYMMKAKFKLNYLDILSLNMNERIFVNGSWWNINRIIDYDLNANNLTEVELITAAPAGNLGSFIANNNLFVNKLLIGDTINSWGRLTDRTNKMNNVSNGTINGRSNKVEETQNTIVIGDFNYVKNNNGLIIGSNNIVNGSGIIVLGGNNKTYEGTNKVYVNGLVEQVDLIDAGQNWIRNPFGDTNIHLIDGSVDEVMNIGSHTNIHLIDGGTD